MGANQSILASESVSSYFALNINSDLTPDAFVNGTNEGLFVLDLNTGDLIPNSDTNEDALFELVSGEITPKIL